MKKLILFILLGVIFVGCAKSSLELNKKSELLFEYNTQSFLFSNSITEHNFLNYKDLFVEQYKLENENGRVLFYEEATTELDFEFNFGGLYTVMYIFSDVQEYEELYRDNNLRLVQLKLKDKQYINILIQASDTQFISYVYGFSNAEFIKLAKQLSQESNREIKQLKHQGIILSKSQKPVTNWNAKMVFFTPLITPLRTMGLR
jgi:hypothetical protein